MYQVSSVGCVLVRFPLCVQTWTWLNFKITGGSSVYLRVDKRRYDPTVTAFQLQRIFLNEIGEELFLDKWLNPTLYKNETTKNDLVSEEQSSLAALFDVNQSQSGLLVPSRNFFSLDFSRGEKDFSSRYYFYSKVYATAF